MKSAFRLTVLLIGLFTALAVAAEPPAPVPPKLAKPAAPVTPLPSSRPMEKPAPAITHVVLISIDGCRPDLLLRADTPVIHGLLPKASFSFWARTTVESVTLPSHTSMLTGVVPIKHEIQWNKDLPLEHPVYPKWPTVSNWLKIRLHHCDGRRQGQVYKPGRARLAGLAVHHHGREDRRRRSDRRGGVDHSGT